MKGFRDTYLEPYLDALHKEEPGAASDYLEARKRCLALEAEWNALRKFQGVHAHIGGSDLAGFAVNTAGELIHPYSDGPAGFYAQKMGIPGVAREFRDSWETQMGHEMERRILDEWMEGVSGVRQILSPGYLHSVKWPRLIATPDYLALTDAGLVLLEIKNVGRNVWSSGAWGESGDGKNVPLYVRVQVEYYMQILGSTEATPLAYAVVLAMIDTPQGKQIRHYQLPRDEASRKMGAALVRQALKMLACIDTGTMPDAAHLRADYKLQDALYGPEEDRVDALAEDHGVAGVIDLMARVRARIKRWDHFLCKKRNEIGQIMATENIRMMHDKHYGLQKTARDLRLKELK